jgi:hypothetical protein
MPRLRELRILGDHWLDIQRANLAPLLGRLRAPLEILAITQHDAPIAAIADNPSYRQLHTLDLQWGCEPLDIGELRRLPELRTFRCSISEPRAAQTIAACRVLEDLSLSGMALDDDAAELIAAGLPALRRLKLGATAIRDRGILALSELLRIEDFAYEDATKLTEPTRIRLRFSRSPGVREAFKWASFIKWLPTPEPPPLPGPREGAWPKASARRRFVVQRVRLCSISACNGYGWGAEGHCPDHRDPELLVEAASDPRSDLTACDETIADVERRCASLVELDGEKLEEIVWVQRFGQWEDPTPPAFDAIARQLDVPWDLAKVRAWPYIWKAAGRLTGLSPDDVARIDHAVALLDHGVHLLDVQGRVVQVLWPTSDSRFG